MNRRALLKAAGCSMLLTGGLLPSVGFTQALTQPDVRSPLFHVFGQLPEPVEVKRVFAAGPAAAVLLNSLAPAQLMGWPVALSESSKKWLSATSARLPVLGRLAELGPDLDPVQIMTLKPDVIVAVGQADAQKLAMAKQFSEITQIPYVLIEGGLADAPEQLKIMGAVLGQHRHGQQLAQTAQEVLDGVAAQRQAAAQAGPRVYVARSATGLETLGEQSSVNELIHLVGGVNVVQAPNDELEVSLEQVLAWDPELILTQNPSFYQQVYQDPQWQQVQAVRNKQVLFVPTVPFGWLEDPLSINRLLGAVWLSAKTHQESEDVVLQKLRHLFVMLYQFAPTTEQLKPLLADPVQFAL